MLTIVEQRNLMNYNGRPAYNGIRDEHMSVFVQARKGKVEISRLYPARIVFQTSYNWIKVSKIASFDTFYLFKQAAIEDFGQFFVFCMIIHYFTVLRLEENVKVCFRRIQEQTEEASMEFIMVLTSDGARPLLHLLLNI